MKKIELKKGFSLVEILVAIAIIGILAGVFLVSLSSYRNSGNATRANSKLNSAVASMVSCWAFGGKVNQPAKGINICSYGDTYGKWPDLSEENFYYDPNENNCVSCTSLGYSPSENYLAEKTENNWIDFFICRAKAMVLPNCIDKNSNWFFSAKNLSGSQKICCNKKMKSCKVIDSTCDQSVN